MAALMLVLMLCIMNMLVDVGLAVVLVSMFMLIICMATHLDSPPISIFRQSNLVILNIKSLLCEFTRYIIDFQEKKATIYSKEQNFAHKC